MMRQSYSLYSVSVCCREATVTAEMDWTEGLKLQLSEVTPVGGDLDGTVLASAWVAVIAQ